LLQPNRALSQYLKNIFESPENIDLTSFFDIMLIGMKKFDRDLIRDGYKCLKREIIRTANSINMRSEKCKEICNEIDTLSSSALGNQFDDGFKCGVIFLQRICLDNYFISVPDINRLFIDEIGKIARKALKAQRNDLSKLAIQSLGTVNL